MDHGKQHDQMANTAVCMALEMAGANLFNGDQASYPCDVA